MCNKKIDKKSGLIKLMKLNMTSATLDLSEHVMSTADDIKDLMTGVSCVECSNYCGIFAIKTRDCQAFGGRDHKERMNDKNRGRVDYMQNCLSILAHDINILKTCSEWESYATKFKLRELCASVGVKF